MITFRTMAGFLGWRSDEKGLAAREETIGHQSAWACGGIEPTIDDLLSDPMAIAAMERDGLRPEDVRAVFHECKQRHDAGLLWPGLRNPPILKQFVRMLALIELDTEKTPLKPSTRIDLFAACLGCPNREPCSRWLDSENAAEGYQDFCPNARMFDRLLRVSRWRRT